MQYKSNEDNTEIEIRNNRMSILSLRLYIHIRHKSRFKEEEEGKKEEEEKHGNACRIRKSRDSRIVA